MLAAPQEPRMWWGGDEIGWVIDVQHVLSRPMVKRCIDFTLKVQQQRYAALPLGERRDECMRTIVALKKGKVKQNVVGTGDHVLFGAEMAHERKVFVPGSSGLN